MPLTLKSLKKIALLYNATVVDEKDSMYHECRVEAPQGFKWLEGGVHEFVDVTHVPWKPDYDDLADRMKFGIEKCIDPECDWCHPED